MTKWVTKKFNDFFDMLPTNTLSRDKLNDQFGIYQNIHYGDVLIKYPFCLDCNSNEIPYINDGENFNKRALLRSVCRRLSLRNSITTTMAHTKYKTKVKYKDTLYPHLLMACIASECKEEDIAFHPKMVIKDVLCLM